VRKRSIDINEALKELSDGKPLDRDYFGNYAIEDTRMALRAEVLYQVVLYHR